MGLQKTISPELDVFIPGWREELSEITALRQALTAETQRADEAVRLMSQYAREAGEATGRLEMSEAASVVDEWRERAERAEGELAVAVDRAQRNSDALRDGMKMPGDGPRQFPVWMERSVGCCFAWLVWAVKPGAVRLIAICSTEAIADRYASNLPPGLSEFKSWKERAPIDHSFGFADSMHARVQGKIS